MCVFGRHLLASEGTCPCHPLENTHPCFIFPEGGRNCAPCFCTVSWVGLKRRFGLRLSSCKTELTSLPVSDRGLTGRCWGHSGPSAVHVPLHRRGSHLQGAAGAPCPLHSQMLRWPLLARWGKHNTACVTLKSFRTTSPFKMTLGLFSKPRSLLNSR